MLWGIFRHKAQVCVHLLFIREQKVLGSKSYFPTIPADTLDSQILSAFIGQHYLVNEAFHGVIPKEIVTGQVAEDQNQLEQLLSAQAGYEVRIATNVRKERSQYLKLAAT